MQSKGMVLAWAALGAALLVACSSTKRGEEPQQARSAVEHGLGSADAPNDCGSYTGDAAFITTSSDGAQFGGDITAGSPAQSGRFALGAEGGPTPPSHVGNFSSAWCETPYPTPVVTNQGRDVRYNEIFLKNWTNADACISVWGTHLGHLDATDAFQIGGYVGGFDPNDIAKNNVAFWGGYVAELAFKVPANAAFEIVVMAEAPYVDGAKVADVSVHWGINVANCGQQESAGGSSSGGSSSGGSSSGGTSSGSGGSSSGSGGSSSGGGSSSSGGGSSGGDDGGTGGGKSW